MTTLDARAAQRPDSLGIVLAWMRAMTAMTGEVPGTAEARS